MPQPAFISTIFAAVSFTSILLFNQLQINTYRQPSWPPNTAQERTSIVLMADTPPEFKRKMQVSAKYELPIDVSTFPTQPTPSTKRPTVTAIKSSTTASASAPTVAQSSPQPASPPPSPPQDPTPNLSLLLLFKSSNLLLSSDALMSQSMKIGNE